MARNWFAKWGWSMKTPTWFVGRLSLSEPLVDQYGDELWGHLRNRNGYKATWKRGWSCLDFSHFKYFLKISSNQRPRCPIKNLPVFLPWFKLPFSLYLNLICHVQLVPSCFPSCLVPRRGFPTLWLWEVFAGGGHRLCWCGVPKDAEDLWSYGLLDGDEWRKHCNLLNRELLVIFSLQPYFLVPFGDYVCILGFWKTNPR